MGGSTLPFGKPDLAAYRRPSRSQPATMKKDASNSASQPGSSGPWDTDSVS